MALLDEEIQQNKIKFLDLVNSIQREGMDKELLMRQLNESDFFYAPASISYHNSYTGGLCEHSLKVYDALCRLVSAFDPNRWGEPGAEDTMKIVALFHDFSKMSFYTTEVKNKKVYSESGKKTDSMGKYDWVSVPGYGVRDIKDRFLIGSHEENAAFMINSFIPLTAEEWCAISHHHAGIANDSTKQNPADYWTKFPLSMLLHQADCLATFLEEETWK